jgi:hypothetical protein
VVAEPDGNGAVGVALEGELDRHEGGGTVVLGPVELDAAGDPGAGKADESGLDDVLAVEEIVLAEFVEADMNTAADFREDHEAEELVFEVDGLPEVGNGVGSNAIDDREGIDAAAAALVDTVFEEERVGVWFRRQVGEDRDGLGPCLDGARLLLGWWREDEFGWIG